MSNPINRVFESFTPTEEQKEKMYREMMKKKINANNHEPTRYRKRKGWSLYLAASVLVVVVCVYVFSSANSDNTAFALYEYETNTELTSAEAALSTGAIDDHGSMAGNLLQFTVQGKSIEKIRFSVKNQYLSFTDWTESRPNHSVEKQFSINYGERESDYGFLLIEWMPERTISELTNKAESTIASLTEDLRSDIIVMEIEFENGTNITKALYINIQASGKVAVHLQDYTVTDKDAFIHKPIHNDRMPRKKPDKIIDPNANAKYSQYEIQAAEKVAQKYYAKFPEARQIVKINVVNYLMQLSSYIADEYKDWEIIAFEAYEKSMYPNEAARHIILAREDASKEWAVINEGY